MAFGKDSDRLNKMNFGQAGRRSTHKPGRGAKRGPPTFINRFRPPTSGSAIIRPLPGQYKMPRVDMEARDYVYDPVTQQPIVDVLPFYKYIEYSKRLSRDRFVGNCIGSEGPLGIFKDKGEPCLAQDWFWYEWNVREATGQRYPNTVNRRELWVLSILVQGNFFKIPQMDRETGRPRLNKRQEPFYEWVQGTRQTAKEYTAGGYEQKNGHVMHWSMGYGHWTSLMDFNESLGRHCRACYTQDSINLLAWTCQGCGEAVIDMAETSLSEAEIEQMISDEVQCQHCKHIGYLADVVECSKCGNPARATIFDFDLEVKRVETSEGNQTTLQFIRANGPRPIDPIFGEDLRKPLPLETIFQPASLSRQREIFGSLPEVNPEDYTVTPGEEGDMGEEDSYVPARTPVNS